MKVKYVISAKITGIFAGFAVLMTAATVVFCAGDDTDAMKILALLGVPITLCAPLPPLFFFRYELDLSDQTVLKGRYFFRYRTMKLCDITNVRKDGRAPNIIIECSGRLFYVNYRNCKNADILIKLLTENIGGVCTKEVKELQKYSEKE